MLAHLVLVSLKYHNKIYFQGEQALNFPCLLHFLSLSSDIPLLERNSTVLNMWVVYTTQSLHHTKSDARTWAYVFQWCKIFIFNPFFPRLGWQPGLEPANSEPEMRTGAQLSETSGPSVIYCPTVFLDV